MRHSVLVLLLLVACAPPATMQREALLARAKSNPAASLESLQALLRLHGLPINHWPDSIRTDSLNAAGAEGPCGPEMDLWVRRMRPQTKDFGVDRVIEFDDSSVVRDWLTPANSTPSAIQGNSLLYSPPWPIEDSTAMIAIAADGELAVVRGFAVFPPWVPVECPPHAREARSDFWSCFEFVDVLSGAKRRLGFNGICT